MNSRLSLAEYENYFRLLSSHSHQNISDQILYKVNNKIGLYNSKINK